MNPPADVRRESAEVLKALKGSTIFRDLDAETFDRIANRIRWKRYRRGTEVFHHRDTDDEVYFIASGRVRVTIFSYAGKEISYQELYAGEMFGELSALDRKPRTANVIVIEDAFLGVMTGDDFRVEIAASPAFSFAMLIRIASLVRFLAGRVYEYGALDVNDRVRAELLRMSRDNESEDGSATIRDFPTHNEIANRINTHREAVTRELNRLSRMGVIEQRRRTLKVFDIRRLADLLPDDT